MDFYGTYDCKVDAKGRFKMPVKVLEQLDPNKSGEFVVTVGFEGQLELYTTKQWNWLRGEFMKSYKKFNRKVRMSYDVFFGNANKLSLDSAQRLNLPSVLMEIAAIEDKSAIVVTAGFDNYQIWNKQRRADYMKKAMEENVLGDGDDAMSGFQPYANKDLDD